MPPDPRHVTAVQSRLAQLVGESLIHAHPWLAEITEDTKERYRDAWLEGLEAHTTEFAGELLAKLAEQGDPPAEIAGMLAAIKDPSAQFGSLIQQFFIYGLMFQLAGTMLAPFTQQVSNNIWQANPDRPIPPPDIATGVVRGITPGVTADVPLPQWAIDAAAESGFAQPMMQFLSDITGSPPDATSLFEMIRRGIISEDELVKGMRESDLRDSWIASMVKLRYVTPTPADLVRSAVQNQISYADASQLAGQLGLEPPAYVNDNPDWFRLLYDTYGRPPGPVEMGHAANRGLTDWDGTGPDSVSFHQAISESDIKDKYIPLLQKLAVYYPPNGEIRTLLMHGGITEDQAVALWTANGVPTEIAHAYLHLAQVEQITQDKAIAKTDILTLVKEQAISDAQATELLGQIGFTDGNAATLILMAHYQYELEVLRRTVGQIGTLYTSHKINDAQARAGFQNLGLEVDQIDRLLNTLAAERAASVASPTATQVASGLFYGILDQATAERLLAQLGYQPWEAWFVLSVRVHGKLPNEPAMPAEIT